MTIHNLKLTISDWIANEAAASYPDLDAVPVVRNGEISDMEFPLIAIVDTGSEQIEQDGVIMRGVMNASVNVELHSVPAADDQEGTDEEDHAVLEADLYDILGDMNFLPYGDNRNDLRIFDIRTAAPTLEARDGRRVSVFQMSFVCCPNT